MTHKNHLVFLEILQPVIKTLEWSSSCRCSNRRETISREGGGNRARHDQGELQCRKNKWKWFNRGWYLYQ